MMWLRIILFRLIHQIMEHCHFSSFDCQWIKVDDFVRINHSVKPLRLLFLACTRAWLLHSRGGSWLVLPLVIWDALLQVAHAHLLRRLRIFLLKFLLSHLIFSWSAFAFFSFWRFLRFCLTLQFSYKIDFVNKSDWNHAFYTLIATLTAPNASKPSYLATQPLSRLHRTRSRHPRLCLGSESRLRPKIC